MRHEATHWGAPFAGRHKDLSLLLHLMQEGFSGNLAHICVRGDRGVGRRRLLREAFRQGPWSEWIDLSPSGLVVDLERWSHGELPDFLAAYPHNTIPSWSLAVLSKFNPRLRRYAAHPILSSAGIPFSPETVAAAIAAVAVSLSAYAPIVIHVAMEPERNTWEWSLIQALARRSTMPGVVLVTIAAKETGQIDSPHQRSLVLEPLTAHGVLEVTRTWFGDHAARNLAPWLHRATGGNAFALSETLRWLEEAGCIYLHESTGTAEILQEISRFPVPFNLHSIMHTRWQRLAPGARYVFHQIVKNPGQLTYEELWRSYPGRDGDRGFHEGMAYLRRRAFLYRSTFRHPLSPASLEWRTISEAPSKRKFKRLKSKPPSMPPRTTVSTPLSQALAALAKAHHQLLNCENPQSISLGLVPIVRISRQRHTPGWDGVWGRVSCLLAVTFVRRGKPRKALFWCQRGLDRLNPEVFPGLRRSLGCVQATAWTRVESRQSARKLRRTLREEALWVGDFYPAAELALLEHEDYFRERPTPHVKEEKQNAVHLLQSMGRTPRVHGFGLPKDDGTAKADRMPAPVPVGVLTGARRPLCLHVFGGRGVALPMGLKPFSLYPEWWHMMLAVSVSRSLLGEHSKLSELQEVFTQSEGGGWDPRYVLHDFNRTLFGENPGAGGLRLEGSTVRFGFSDVWCDAQELLSLPESTTSLAAVSSLVRGHYWPGLELPVVHAARERLQAKVLSLFSANRETLTADAAHAWIEGPARLVQGRARIAPRVRLANRPRLARLLEGAFP